MEKYNQTVKDYEEKGYQTLTLTDQQAVVVEGENYKVIDF